MPKLTARERPVVAFISLIALALLLAISLVPTVGGAPVQAVDESASELPFSEGPTPDETPPQEELCSAPDSAGPLPQGSQAISGTITDEAGAVGPLGGIQVRFSTNEGGFSQGSAITEPEGTYIKGGLGDGTFRLSFFDGNAVYQSGFHGASGLVLTPGEAEVVVLSGLGAVVDEALPYELTRNVRGVVTDSSDLPLAGVQLLAESPYFPIVACKTTTSDGSFVIPGVRTMAFRIRVTDTNGVHPNGFYSAGAPGNFTTAFAQATLLIAGPADMEGFNIKFPPIYTLSGVVHDDAPTLVEGLRVTACGTAGQGCANDESDELGAFTIVGLVAGDYILRMDGFAVGYLDGYYDGEGAFTSFEADAEPVTIVDDDVAGLDLLAVPPPTAPTPECAGEECQPIPLDDGTGATPVTLTFENVTSGGTTTLTIPPQQESTPAGFKFGEPPTYYEITTTATLAVGSPYLICVTFDPADFDDPAGVRLFHLVSEPSPGGWENITLPGYPLAGVVCGEAGSLSPFALVEPEYSFGGFFGAKAPPQLNQAKAGDLVGIQFSLGADIGLSIFLAGSPTVERVDCATGATIGGSVAAASGTPALKFNARTQRYAFQWKTDKAWKNTCQRLVLTFRDESSAEVIFHFKK